MSRHEGVSCDSCLKSNFTGRRYKCLICYDYDLCADCYEDGATSTRHLNEHPMQCILTRADIELYFGGELLSTEQPQSFTCPYCKKMGFSDQTLADHVNNEHTAETGLEVVCPVCAGSPGGDPNLVTDDFAGHLTLGHRSGPRELMSFLDEPSAIRHGGGVRRIQPGRALGGPRSRRSNMHFSSSSGLATLSPSGRESVDPIAELLSQLSGVRRTGGSSQQSSQLQQLQMQIQLERQQATRQQLERFPRRNHMVSASNVNSSMAEVVSGNGGGSASTTSGTGNISVSSGPAVGLIGSQSGIGVGTAISSRNGGGSVTGEIPLSSSGMHVASFGNANPNLFGGLISGIASGINNIHLANNMLSTNAPQPNTAGGSSSDSHSQFLLTKFLTPSLTDEELAQLEKDRADRSLFVQELVLSTLSSFKLNENDESNDNDDNSYLSELNKNNNSDMSNINETNSEVTTQTPINNQVDQQQQTNPDDFLEEYSFHQTAPITPQQQQHQHPTQPNYNKKKQQSSTASATAPAVVLERRVKPPPGQQQQQQQTQGRAVSKAVSAAKEIPDSR